MKLRFALIGAVIALSSLTAQASDTSKEAVPTDSSSVRWWQLFGSIPNDIRARMGEDPAACGIGQHGNTWYIATSQSGNGLVTRRCTVPKGTSLFIPLITALCIPYPGETLPENVQLCHDLIEPFDVLTFKVDGKNSKGLIERRVHSRAFPIWFPEKNYFDLPGEDVPAGVYTAVADGYYALLELEPGRHTIYAKAMSTLSPEIPVFEYTYEINVLTAKGIVPK
jgi:hypothetical protein